MNRLLIINKGETIQGKVIAVHDGDTISIEILVPDSEPYIIRVRLAFIDAPELDQDFGAAAMAAMSEMVLGKEVSVYVEAVDCFGRAIGVAKVIDGPDDVSEEMIKKGLAWVFRRYKHPTGFLYLEDDAAIHAEGLWSKPNPIPPWDWRYYRWCRILPLK